VGLNRADDDGFLRAVKIQSTTFSKGKQSLRPHVVRFYGMLKVPAEYDRDTSPAILKNVLLQVYIFGLLLGVSDGICQRALADESGIIRTQMGKYSISENGLSCTGRFVRYHPVTVTSTVPVQ
jgi:hypothetical protein